MVYTFKKITLWLIYVKPRGHHPVGLGAIRNDRRPSLAHKPEGVATNLMGRNDVLVVTVTNDERLRGVAYSYRPQTHAPYLGVGLSHSHYSRLNYLTETIVEPKLTEHCIYISIEIA